MGFGDEIMATGLARGAAARGKLVAFGDGQRIIWGPSCEQIFRHNPNIARPDAINGHHLQWIAHHKGNRMYNRVAPERNRWIWKMDFRPVPGEMFFSPDEKAFAETIAGGFVLLEPNVPWQKTCAPNKDWGFQKYQTVADTLRHCGLEVRQFSFSAQQKALANVPVINAPTFRHAMAALSRAVLYIGPEGGLHHAAAAVGVRAVVLFGGFIPPAVTGYAGHTNLTGGAAEACGSLGPCQHCRDAMAAISVDEVVAAAGNYLS